MTHYIIEDGPFAEAATDLLALGWGIQYVDRAGRFTASPWTWTWASGEGRSKGQGGSHAGQSLSAQDAKLLHGESLA